MMFFKYDSPTAPIPQIIQEPHPEGVFCDGCGSLIEIGEDSVEILIGMIGRGGKSGRLMVVDHKAETFTPATLHIWCIHGWATDNIWEGPPPNDSPQLCDGCGNKLDDKILGDDD